MKIARIFLASAAVGLIVGCSSTGNSRQYTQTPTPPSNASADLNHNVDGSLGNPTLTYNEGAYNPPGTPGTEHRHVLSIADLPQPAQTTIRNQIGAEPIAKIKQESKDGQTSYRVELPRPHWYSERPSLLVAGDGSLLKESHMKNINEAAGAQTPQPLTNDISGSSVNNPSSNQVK
jgi:hypothetical protein